MIVLQPRKGSGIGLAYLVEIGNICELPQTSRRELYCALVSRLFLAPSESSFAAKALRKLFESAGADEQKDFSSLLHQVVKHNKAPDKNGRLAEKSLALAEIAGYKELIKTMQEKELDKHIFNILAIGISDFIGNVGEVQSDVITALLPHLMVMVNHKGQSIRSVGKTVFTVFEGNRRIATQINQTVGHVIDLLGGFDGDFREAAARTLPQSGLSKSGSDG